jgi:uncharacterized integral membrane protein
MAEKFCRKWRLPRHFWFLLHDLILIIIIIIIIINDPHFAIQNHASISFNLHNEELQNFVRLINIMGVIKSIMKRWMARAARVMEKRNPCRVLVGKSEVKRLL